MKNLNQIKRFTLVILLGFLSVNVMATDDTDNEGDANISLEPSKTNATVLIRIWNISTTIPATIEVLNKFGNAIYQETIEKKQSHVKEYDFSNLRTGKYTLVLKSESGRVDKPFFVDKNGIVTEDNSELFKQFKPTILKKRGVDKVEVTFENNTGIPLVVRLSDKYGKILYSEKVQGHQNFAKAINLKLLPSGHYRVEIVGDNYGYHKEIQKF